MTPFKGCRRHDEAAGGDGTPSPPNEALTPAKPYLDIRSSLQFALCKKNLLTFLFRILGNLPLGKRTDLVCIAT